jgi:uncharacterized membrane protein
MTFIILLLVVVFFFIIHNRLNVIENLLEEIKKGRAPVSTPISTPATTPSPVATVTTSMPASVATPVATVSQSQPQPQPQSRPIPPAQPTQSSEETFGKTLGIVGIFAVLFGIAFFLKYAFDTGLIGITGRLILGAGVGILGIVLGRMLKAKYEAYSHILSGGGIGILFITAYTAHVLYDVISAPVAYIIFGIIMITSVILSVKDGKMLLAAVGVSAGFLAPLLVSFGTESFVGLFTYMLIINAGVAVISYTYRWPALHYISFIGTLISVSTWFDRVQDESSRLLFVTFITLYFIIFLASSIFHHVVRKEMSTEGDIAFVTVNALWYISIAYPILHPVFPDGMGIFMAIIGLMYLVVGYFSFTAHKEDKLLNAALPLIGLLFVTVAIPIHFDGSWTTVAWVIEALALCVIDFKINGQRLYKYALIVYFIGLFNLAVDSAGMGVGEIFIPIFNERFVTYVIAILSGLLMAYVIHRATKETPEEMESLKPVPVFLGVVTQLITLYLFTSEIHLYFSNIDGVSTGSSGLENTIISIVWALYAAFLTIIGFAKHTKAFRVFGMVLFLLTAARIFLSLWELGPLYRIVTSIIFGIIALAASFLYARFKERIKGW